ncbi:Hsp70 protein that interacts with Zuo1p [Coemansia guatemalensis]|uniref:Hsp70 protein that interacts with Zuo1p n=1 Tax=Coemansia guatemalensis TaxID=2761395 RepID=A0A9W8HYF9_9FUNG|nr:Hsp70 protein that interacts with Zuo1p [Coemansia guatemalensis]
MATSKTFIGLSLGNQNSVIAIINKEHQAEVIANEDGEHKTPTYIAFSGEEEYHGSQAKHQIVRNAQNTIMGFRDLLGKQYSDDMAQLHEGYARIERGDSGEPVFVVTTENDDGEQKSLRLTPHDVAVRYLVRLKTTAEEYLGRKIEGAVLAVPVGFDEAQRKSVAATCADAGLPLLQLVSEPVAAAVQYGLGQDASHDDAKDTVAVVVDVGSTGSDITVLAVNGGLFTVAASKHTTEVSGNLTDDVLVKYFAAEFKKLHNIDVLSQGNSRSLRKLQQAVEVTKRTLSAAPAAPCAVESLAEGLDFNGTITRTRFDILANKSYGPLLDTITETIEASGYTPAQIDQVLLCGGAARVRKLQTRVAGLFPETTEVRDDAGELDEVVASGCAAQAALIAQGIVQDSDAKELAAKVLAKSVGLQLSAEKLVPVLQQNTPLPASRTIKVSLPAGQKRAYIAVSEGEPVPPKEDEDEDEDEDSSDEQSQADNEDDEPPARYRPSKLLAEMILELDAVTAATRIEVKFFVDTDLKLTVTATEPDSGKSITAEVPASGSA